MMAHATVSKSVIATIKVYGARGECTLVVDRLPSERCCKLCERPAAVIKYGMGLDVSARSWS